MGGTGARESFDDVGTTACGGDVFGQHWLGHAEGSQGGFGVHSGEGEVGVDFAEEVFDVFVHFAAGGEVGFQGGGFAGGVGAGFGEDLGRADVFVEGDCVDFGVAAGEEGGYLHGLLQLGGGVDGAEVEGGHFEESEGRPAYLLTLLILG